MLLATLWHVHDSWRWNCERALAGCLAESVRLQQAEHAQFQATIDQESALIHERARLDRTLRDLCYPDWKAEVGCYAPMYLVQISGLVERMQKSEAPSLEVICCSPVQGELVRENRAKIPVSSYDLDLVGHYGSIVELLRRLQQMKYARLVLLTRVSLSPCSARWDGLWSGRIRVSVGRWDPPDELY